MAITPGTAESRPIFILGILQRSGTNFLYDLLRLHPDVGVAAPIWEDFLLPDADLLVGYARAVARRWDPRWGVDAGAEAALRHHLGDGVIRFLAERTDRPYVLTKTPRLWNLDRFFELFPRAHLLIIVRDGRSVTQSGVDSFGWSYEWSMHEWAAAAADIIRFEERERGSSHRYRIVRYEDLCADLVGELRRTLDFLALDTTCYDFESATRLPVRGSSTLRQGGETEVHWQPVTKTPTFASAERWRGWSRELHGRFEWIAGRYNRHFGYEPVPAAGPGLRWTLRNLALDLAWSTRATLKPLTRVAGRGLRPASTSPAPERRQASVS